MKNTISALAVLTALMVLFPSCHKEEVSESTFSVTPKTIRAEQATFEVVPVTNEFYYYADAITVADYNRYGERAIADSIVRYYDKVKDQLNKAGIPYDNDFLYYRGLYDCTTTKLPPETNCYFFCMRLSKHNQTPILPLHLTPFTTTKKIVHDDFVISLSITKDSVHYEPNNATYPYMADFVSWEELKKSYAGDIELYFNSTLATYESFDLMDQVVVKGPVSYAINDWYRDIQPGDSIVAFAIGYEENNLTTELQAKTLIIEW